MAQKLLQTVESELYPERNKSNSGSGWIWVLVIVGIVIVGGLIAYFSLKKKRTLRK